MGINRLLGTGRIVLPSGCATRGANGLYTPDLSLADVNPYPGALHGLDEGKNWSNVQLVSNRLHGTVLSGAPPYDDGVMLFPGTWGDDLVITGTIYRGPNATAAASQEVEFLLCGEISPYHASFYEVMMSVHGSNPYADIVRWNGEGGNIINNYEIAVHRDAGNGVPVVANGDVFQVKKIGNNITSYLNAVQMATLDITTVAANPYGLSVYKKGLPGVGFYQRLGATSNLLEFGLTNVTISAP